MKKILDILINRDFLGGFGGALVGSVISYLTLGVEIGWAYTLFGAFLGATLGYYHMKVWLSMKAALESVSNWTSEFNFPMPKFLKKKRPSPREQHQRRRWGLDNKAIALRLVALFLSLVVFGGGAYLSIALTGHWHWLVKCGWGIGVLIFIVAVRGAHMESDPRRRTENRLGRNELIVLGEQRFLLKAVRLVFGILAETIIFLVPAIELCLIVWALGIAIGLLAFLVFMGTYGFIVGTMKLVYLAVTKRGQWFSFGVASVVLLLSLWFRPWVGNESFGFLIAASSMNALVAGLASVGARRLVEKLSERFEWNLKLTEPFEWMIYAIDQRITLVNKRLIKGARSLRQKLQLSPVEII